MTVWFATMVVLLTEMVIARATMVILLTEMVIARAMMVESMIIIFLMMMIVIVVTARMNWKHLGSSKPYNVYSPTSGVTPCHVTSVLIICAMAILTVMTTQTRIASTLVRLILQTSKPF